MTSAAAAALQTAVERWNAGDLDGTHAGEFMGVPPTARAIALPGITIVRFDGARVVERHSCADMLGLLVALGAVAPPG